MLRVKLKVRVVLFVETKTVFYLDLKVVEKQVLQILYNCFNHYNIWVEDSQTKIVHVTYL